MNALLTPRTIRRNGFVYDYVPSRHNLARRSEKRPCLVFLHGAFGGRWYLRDLLARMSLYGYNACSLDLKGHGGRYPDPALGRYCVEDYVMDVLKALRGGMSNLDTKQIVLVGHSMGGLIAQAVAQEYPVAALVLIMSAPPRGIPYRATKEGPTLSFGELARVAWKMFRGEPYFPPREAIRAMFAHRPLPHAEFEDLYKRFTPESLYVIRQLYWSEIPIDPGRINAPRLVIGAEKDTVIAPATIREIGEFLEVRPILFPNLGHFFVKEPGWEEVADYIARWLALRVA